MIRYPGSKDKIIKPIIRRFPDALRLGGLFTMDRLEYREPFFGAGAIGFQVLTMLGPRHSVWLNDLDYGIACLWKAVYELPDDLCDQVRRFTPTVDNFYRFREEDGIRDGDVVRTALRKLALHQTSFSGLGVKAGGPIGGRHQSSEYNVSCRWSASRLCRDIQARHRLLARFRHVEISCKDFADLISGAPSHVFIYADPPYVKKGAQLYKYSMSDADHARLARLLQQCRAPWVLSYDDHPMIRQLYSWARIESVELTYTTAVASGSRRKNNEIIVSREDEDRLVKKAG